MIYSTKEKAPPGNYKCTICGHEKKYDEEGNLIPCPKCNNIKWEKLI